MLKKVKIAFSIIYLFAAFASIPASTKPASTKPTSPNNDQVDLSQILLTLGDKKNKSHLSDYIQLMTHNSIVKKMREQAEQSKNQYGRFFIMRYDSDKVAAYQSEYMAKSVQNAPKLFPNYRFGRLIYDASKQKFSLSRQDNGYSFPGHNTTGSRAYDLGLAKIKSQKTDLFWRNRSSSLSTGSIGVYGVIRALEQFYIKAGVLTEICLQGKGGGLVDISSCAIDHIRISYPNYAVLLQKYWQIFAQTSGTQKTKAKLPTINFYLKMRDKNWQQDFPHNWQSNKRVMEQVDYSILFKDAHKRDLGGIKYEKNSRLWHFWYRYHRQSGHVYPLTSNKNNFLPSELRKERFYWLMSANIDVFGLNIRIQNAWIAVDYERQADNAAGISLSWHKNALIASSGKFAKVLPSWLLDYMIPGTVTSIFNDYMHTLSGMGNDDLAWSMRYFSTSYRGRQMMLWQSQYLTFQHGFFTSLFQYFGAEKKYDTPSASQVFYQAAAEDARLLLGNKPSK